MIIGNIIDTTPRPSLIWPRKHLALSYPVAVERGKNFSSSQSFVIKLSRLLIKRLNNTGEYAQNGRFVSGYVVYSIYDYIKIPDFLRYEDSLYVIRNQGVIVIDSVIPTDSFCDTY